jgi:hypothetical protein
MSLMGARGIDDSFPSKRGRGELRVELLADPGRFGHEDVSLSDLVEPQNRVAPKSCQDAAPVSGPLLKVWL